MCTGVPNIYSTQSLFSKLDRIYNCYQLCIQHINCVLKKMLTFSVTHILPIIETHILPIIETLYRKFQIYVNKLITFTLYAMTSLTLSRSSKNIAKVHNRQRITIVFGLVKFIYLPQSLHSH